MPRPPRPLYKGAFYHVYNRGVDKHTIFLDDEDRRVFLRMLKRIVEAFSLDLYAYCLMDNHFHLFLQTRFANLHQCMQKLQAPYAQYINFKYARTGTLFEGRYHSRVVQKDSYALALARYIHQNPLEANMAQALETYRWSSYGCYMDNDPKNHWVKTDWLLQQFHGNPFTAKELFKSFHQIEAETGEFLGARGV